MKRAALLSVSDRTNLCEFARGLSELGFILLCTKGTKGFLLANGIVAESIEEYTGQNEILDGRVKTLHPRIHAGLLAKRDNPEHMQQLNENEIYQIDVAAINLYPFVDGLNSDKVKDSSAMIELIDIGGPTMIRAAAKNFASVFAVIDPNDYGRVLDCLANSNVQAGAALRQQLATKVFTELANYNLEIARYLSQEPSTTQNEGKPKLPAVNGLVMERAQELRYGENPHQYAAFYRPLKQRGERCWKQLQGKELSYNNFLDFDAAFKIVTSLETDRPAVVIVKHLNPCGAAYGRSLFDALERAKAGDPRSHFGGIVACNQVIDSALAEGIAKDFAEIVVAPGFSADALKIFSTRKNLRVIELSAYPTQQTELKSVLDGVLLQQPDYQVSKVREGQLVTKRTVKDQEFADAQLAWSLCAHIKSNAINLVKSDMLLATGAGQMSRIDSVELALAKARTHGHSLIGAVCASDAFFPFPDSLERLAEAGITVIVAPSGAMRDKEIIEVADRLGISLIHTLDRHFRH